MNNVHQLQQPRPAIKCRCGSTVFDGLVVKQVTVIRLLPHTSEAKCKRCKSWVTLPIVYAQ